jgi:hypothetical protein
MTTSAGASAVPASVTSGGAPSWEPEEEVSCPPHIVRTKRSARPKHAMTRLGIAQKDNRVGSVAPIQFEAHRCV